MRAACVRLSGCLAATIILGVAGCAGVTPRSSTGGGGNGATGATGTGGGQGGFIGTDGPPPPIDAITITPVKCGDGNLDSGEQCDDGNKDPGDGCTPLCQIEDGWMCPTPGQKCVMANACGDGILQGSEQCDDHNTTSGDGCSATCAVELGWICRVPGKPCAPLCGDGAITGGEQCDDANTTGGDGCSSTCQVEGGASCPRTAAGAPAPGKCSVSVCGNGMMEGSEGCDCGTDPTKLPSGCSGPNGLFNGDGSGCSKTCTKEPICRGTTGMGSTHACAASCGNGNVEMGEDCDDGNRIGGDGCSPACKLEAGFMCDTKMVPDTQPCMQPGNTGQCLVLPVKYRDFKSEHESGGHPDFFYYGATLATPVSVTSSSHGAGFSFAKRYCVPNSSGPAKQNDSTGRCWGIAQANLDANGRPAATNTTGSTMCDCQFTDWSHDSNGGAVPGYTITNSPLNGITYVSGTNGHPVYRGQAPVVTSATTFGQWWNDGTWESDSKTAGKHAIGSIELGAGDGRDEPLSVLERAARRVGRLLPDRSGREQLPDLHDDGELDRPGRDEDDARGVERTAALQPVALLVQLDLVRRGQRLQGQPVRLPAQLRTAHHLRPRGLGRDAHRRRLDLERAGVVPRFVVLDRGALPVRVQRRVRSAVLRRRRHVRVHQRRAGDRPRRRPPAPAGQGPRQRRRKRHAPWRAATSTCLAPTRPARPTAPRSRRASRSAIWSPATAAPPRPIRSRR